MQVAQPPVHEMQVATSCCDHKEYGHAWSAHSTGSEGDEDGAGEDSGSESYEENEGSVSPEGNDWSQSSQLNDGDDGKPAAPGWLPTPIKCDTGVTIGHILDASAALIEKYRYCSYARGRDHDMRNKGEVWVRPKFTARIPIRTDDLAMNKYREDHMMVGVRRCETNRRDESLLTYAAAKLKGEAVCNRCRM